MRCIQGPDLNQRRVFLRNTRVVLICLVSVALVLICHLGMAQEAAEPSQPKEDGILQQSGRLFDMEIPDGFKPDPVDEPGILKWKKGSGEIYLVVGDLFVKSGDLLFKALKKAADDGKRIKKVETVKIEGGQAMLLEEKPPKEPERPLTWRLIVVMDKKVINVDFTAPAKDFDTYQDDFKKAVKSFKLRTGKEKD
jgi:hypothetical protein